MNEFHLRFEQARDIEFWRQLNPELHITDSDKPFSIPPLNIDAQVLEDVRESLRKDAYFQIHKLIDSALAAKLARGVEIMHKAGWPPPFVVLYDEYWEMFYQLKPLFESILGEGYKQMTSVWCWYLENNSESKGWGHHRDRPGVNVLDADGNPKTLNVWIALTDTTPDNGCIYVVPASRDDHYPNDTIVREVRDLQNIRALPAYAGDVLAWNESLLHWGSRSSSKAKNPRISISFSYQRQDSNPYETPLYDPTRYQRFSERLGLVASNIWNYRDNAKNTPEILFASRQLAGLVPTISFPNGNERQVLEEDKRLSESMLWDMQEQYFEQQNLEAWKRVPFRITSRMPFVESSFELVKAFLLDSANEIDFESPLYILEIGGGSGCFAYRFLNQFMDCKNDFDVLQKLKLKYILSDFSPVIVRNYLANKNFAPHVEAGVLDYAPFRPETETKIKLAISGESLTQEKLKNPLIVISNYVFDTIKHDAFRVDHGVLQETRYTLFRESSNCSLADKARIEDIQTIERFFKAEDGYYDDPALNTILNFYKENLEQASIIFPIGALKTIKNLSQFSNGNMALFAADKGFTTLQTYRVQGFQPHQFSRHGSFSCDVNFDAIERYFQAKGGQTFIENGDNTDLSIMFATTKSSSLQHTKHFWRREMEKKRVFDSSNQLEDLVRDNLQTDEEASIFSLVKRFLAVVRNFNFEPHFFIHAFDRLLEPRRDDLISLEQDMIDELLDCISKVAKNIFIVDEDYAIYDAMLRTYFALGHYPECLALSEKIIESYGEVRTALEHGGLSSDRLGALKQAHDYFQRSYNLDRTNDWARNEMRRIRSLLPKDGDSIVRISIARPN
ncbi:MAG: SAM-dependent methyltransferase [Cyanobacteria bacterium SZAS-4]|nr:SAM-dependent methyltransferase [Cyanobacteria bacterium SZAS-4]